METNDPKNPDNTENPNDTGATSGPVKPLTITISDDLLRRLKVVAVLRDQSVSAVVEGYVTKLVRQDLKKLAPKLEM